MGCVCGCEQAVYRLKERKTKKTYHTCLHQNYPHSRCRSHTASGQAHSGCFYTETGKAHMSAHLCINKQLQVMPKHSTLSHPQYRSPYRTPPGAHLKHLRSLLRHHTSRVLGCSGPSLYSGTHPYHTSFELNQEGVRRLDASFQDNASSSFIFR